jgi:polar amino acid transport system substrate-binding protein
MSVLRAALLWALLALPAIAADCVMTVRMDEDPPYLTTMPDGQPGGVHADIAREALRRMGCKAVFRTLPFTRSLKDLEDGTLDILPDTFRTPERQVYALFSRARNQVPNRLFIRAADQGRWTIRSLQDLPRLGIKLGVEGGALASPDFGAIAADPAFQAILTPARSHNSLWRMLRAGHIDAVILDDLTARWELAHLDLEDQVTGTNFVAAAAPAYFAFSRATVTEQQVHGFDAAVDAMRKDGTLPAILARYGLDPGSAVDISD